MGLILLLVQSLMLMTTVSQPDFTNFSCSGKGNYTKNSIFEKNLERALLSISRNIRPDYACYSRVGEDPDEANAVVLCRGSASLEGCRSCMQNSVTRIRQVCPTQREAVGWYHDCRILYSNYNGSFEGIRGCSSANFHILFNVSRAPDANGFNEALRGLLDTLREKAASGISTSKSAGSDVKLKSPNTYTIYGLVDCFPDMSYFDCNACLSRLQSYLPTCCSGNLGARLIATSCQVSYESHPIYASLLSLPSPPPPPPPSPPPSPSLLTPSLLPPSPPPPPPLLSSPPPRWSPPQLWPPPRWSPPRWSPPRRRSPPQLWPPPWWSPPRLSPPPPTAPSPLSSAADVPGLSSSPQEVSNNTITIIIIFVVSTLFLFTIIMIIVLHLLRKRKRNQNPNTTREREGVESTDEIMSIEMLQFDFEVIKLGTNEFSSENKIGEGGFGAVYKGELPNGRQIAVKRLRKNSQQGDVEFRNEVLLVAKLHHRNLVRLLGFCLQEDERLLIYEFVPNASLDHFVFDVENRKLLDWERRYNIIKGIARGLLYLHEDSPLRIIHRDLKASNILLDEKMNPKIADFGTARMFEVDGTHGNTNRIVGTYGYMAPEYALDGHFSVKSDVFSFGILVLEIISGQKNIGFRNGERVEDLSSFAWKHWKAGTPANVIDPNLTHGSTVQIVRCIHIGLLCVQQKAVDRPTMASVVLMLNSFSLTLPIPSKPAFFMHSNVDESNALSQQDSWLETTRPATFLEPSQNEISITELHPR